MPSTRDVHDIEVGTTDGHATQRVTAIGSESWLGEPLLAVTGTRRMSPTGSRLAIMLGQACAAAGVTLLAPLARGCCIEAAQAAIAAGGHVVAISLGGVDVDYPRFGDTAQAVNVRERADLVISAEPRGAAPMRAAVARRNDLLIALASGLCVIEASPLSGSVRMAGQALAANVPIWAFPGDIGSDMATGAAIIVHGGATPLLDGNDVDAMLRAVRGHRQGRTDGGPTDGERWRVMLTSDDVRLTIDGEALGRLVWPDDDRDLVEVRDITTGERAFVNPVQVVAVTRLAPTTRHRA